MIPYKILATGSEGNASILNKHVLIDCGVPFSMLLPYRYTLSLVLLTHIHSDHFRESTIKRLAGERPTLRWGCGRWLVQNLLRCGVSPYQIDVLEDEFKRYDYGICSVSPVPLEHNVPNQGYRIFFATGSAFYATDMCNLNGIVAKDYDLYMVEANYEEEEIKRRIKEKRAAGEYPYELRAIRDHMSKQATDSWLYRNMGPNSQYIYMHQHRFNDEEGTKIECL